MRRIVIFGAGVLGQGLSEKLKKTHHITMIDNDKSKHNHNIGHPDLLLQLDYDLVYIAVSGKGGEDIKRQLVEDYSVPLYKIVGFYASNSDDLQNLSMRARWLEVFSTYIYRHDIKGTLAEVGVLYGDFSIHMNRLFPDRTLYLFDTFETDPDQRMVDAEQEKNSSIAVFEGNAKRPIYGETSISYVRSRLPYPEKTVFKKGFFPDTFDLEHETFCFVFLDTNFYLPIKAGLSLFYPLLSSGGVILVHDYFHSAQNGVTQAVDEFLEEQNVDAIPCGDNTAVAILKHRQA